MDPLAIAGTVLGGVNVANQLASGITGLIYGDRDRKWREYVYNETKAREDNAVQRRVADLAKAGLSPISEFGGAQSSAGGSSISVPNMNMLGDVDFTTPAKMALQAEQAESKIRLWDSNEALNLLKGEKIRSETSNLMTKLGISAETLKQEKFKTSMLETQKLQDDIFKLLVQSDYGQGLTYGKYKAILQRDELQNILMQMDALEKTSNIYKNADEINIKKMSLLNQFFNTLLKCTGIDFVSNLVGE